MNIKTSKRSPSPQRPQNSARSYLIHPKKTIISGLFPKMSPDRSFTYPYFVSLAKLEHGMGTQEDLDHTLFRLIAGRLFAYKYFDENDAEYLHDAIQAYMHGVGRNPLSGSWELRDDLVGGLRDALNLIDEMQNQMTQKEHDSVVVPMVNWMMEGGVEPAVDTWAEYKKRSDVRALFEQMGLG